MQEIADKLNEIYQWKELKKSEAKKIHEVKKMK